MTAILAAALLLQTPSLPAETAEARCIAARQESNSRVMDVVYVTEDGQNVPPEEIRAAAKHALDVCWNPEVPIDLRNKAAIDYAGRFNSGDELPEKTRILNDALRETEALEGRDGRASLTLIDELVSSYLHIPSRRAEVLDLAERALRIRKTVFGEASPETARGLLNTGTLWMFEEEPQHDFARAEAYFREALSIARTACGPNCDVSILALDRLAAVIAVQPGRESEAEGLEQELTALYDEAVTPSKKQ